MARLNTLEPSPSRPQSGAPLAGRPPRAILVVDDHELVRMGVRALVQVQSSSPDTHIEVYEAGNLADAMAQYARAEETIDLVLLDLALPDTQGLSGLTAFRARFPQARIVVLSGTGSTSLAQSAVAQGAMALGAIAFVAKSADLREVVNFIRGSGLLAGPSPDGSASTRSGAGDSGGGGASANGRPWQALTARQAQVLQWMLEGKANKEIAQLANLSEGTVKNYVSTILLLFGMRSRAQLISSLR